MLVSFFGICTAAESPTDQPYQVVYIQGGESSITNVSGGMMDIKINDIVPFFHITQGAKESMIKIGTVTKAISFPMNAAVVFSDSANQTVSMVMVSNISLSDDDTVLTLRVTPLKFYEGDVLTPFLSKQQALSDSKDVTYKFTQIYAENKPIAENVVDWGCCNFNIGEACYCCTDACDFSTCVAN